MLPISRPTTLLGLLALVSAAIAQTQPPSLTLTDALARAAENNPSLRAEAYAERSAEALIDQAGLRPNPTIDVEAENFAGTGGARGVRGLEATVQASQRFESGGKRGKRVTLARHDRDAAAHGFAAQRAEVLAATAVAFVEALAAQQRVMFANEPVRLARETLDAADARVQAGAGSSAETARARALLATAQAEVGRSEAELVAARARLAATWGGAPDEVPRVEGTLQIPETLPSGATFLAKLSHHPRIAHQHALVAARRSALDLERAQASQDIMVGGGVRYLRENSDAALVAAVSVPLPVRNRNQGNIRAARENLAGAEQKIHAVEAELRAEFIAAWQEAVAAHSVAQALLRDALPATEQANAIVRAAFQQGELPLIDVLDAQRELVALRRELLATETAFAVAHARAEALADPTLPATTALFSK